MIPPSWLEQACERIAPFINRTTLTFDSQENLYIKWENHQVTGSFKIRGALNKILSLEEWEISQGLVTASAGNHGQGVAMAGKTRHAHVTVFASEHASQNKLEAMRNLGAEINLVPGGYAEAEQAGIQFAKNRGATWISPYNDGMVIAGQGTIAIEILADLPTPASTTWVVPAGGGGLVSGIGCALQEIYPRPTLIAVQSDASPFLHEIYHRGTQAGITELPSLADGLAGAVEEGSVTIPMVANYVTDFLLVTEKEIAEAIKHSWSHYHERIEGSAAVTLAAVISGRITARPAVLVMSGGNINPPDFDRIVGFGERE